ncbi:MAG: hypothetical protein C0484_15095 [Rhodospirillum sp.]|nr:hypothetical protein [Rhodospirillum sp.]
MIRRAVAASALMSMLAAAPAGAHPHVFIENKVAFVFDAGKVTGLRLTWAFDDVFSDSLLTQFDADGDGAFDELESKAVGEGILPNLKMFHYFTYVFVDGKQLDPIDPADFAASVDDERIVTFQMKVPLPQPVDPRTAALTAEIYDSEYYVQVDLAQQDPATLENADGAPCSATVRDDTKRAYFGGVVIPQEISLQCR